MTVRPQTQIAVIQCKDGQQGDSELPLAVHHDRRVPGLATSYHVLVRVLAVGLNPTDHKMVTHFYMEGNPVGCDFCGMVVEAGPDALHKTGARVCGAQFPYRPNNQTNGAFAQYVTADSRHVLRVPDTVSDLEAAAMGAIGWGTAALALSDPDALNLVGMPSVPVSVDKPPTVLVYGGATATGVMAIQMLKHSGYTPLAVCSAKSSPMVMRLGAMGTASYTSPTARDDVKQLVADKKLPQIKHALDCIADAESAKVCFGALSRLGGRYACLEAVPESSLTRRAVKVKVVMGFEGQNVDVHLPGNPLYSRKANPSLHTIAARWAAELQPLWDARLLTTLPVREVDGGGFESVIRGLRDLATGQVKGKKLVVRISN